MSGLVAGLAAVGCAAVAFWAQRNPTSPSWARDESATMWKFRRFTMMYGGAAAAALFLAVAVGAI